MSKDILAHVTDMVEDGCRVCRRVQAEGMQVLSLITRDPKSLTELASAQEREKWAAAVKVSLTDSPLEISTMQRLCELSIKRWQLSSSHVLLCCSSTQPGLAGCCGLSCHVMLRKRLTCFSQPTRLSACVTQWQ